jgi:hypothetical protein
MWMSGLNQPLHLDNPGLRLCLIAEVWDQPALSAGLHHFDANAPVILREQPKGRLSHNRQHRLFSAQFHQSQRVFRLRHTVAEAHHGLVPRLNRDGRVVASPA